MRNTISSFGDLLTRGSLDHWIGKRLIVLKAGLWLEGATCVTLINKPTAFRYVAEVTGSHSWQNVTKRWAPIWAATGSRQVAFGWNVRPCKRIYEFCGQISSQSTLSKLSANQWVHITVVNRMSHSAHSSLPSGRISTRCVLHFVCPLPSQWMKLENTTSALWYLVQLTVTVEFYSRGLFTQKNPKNPEKKSEKSGKKSEKNKKKIRKSGKK